MKIAIAGAGIGGLAAAILLERQGHKVSIYEQFETPAPVGSGLMVQPVALRVLQTAGSADRVLDLGTPIRRILGWSAETGQRVLDVSYGSASGIGIHRSALFGALYESARSADINWHTGRRIESRDGQQLVFEDGQRSDIYDLIVDASGSGSRLSPLKGRALGFGAIWATVDWVNGNLPDDYLSQRYRRADRMVGVLPIGRLSGDPVPKAAFFWSLHQDGYEAWKAAGIPRWQDEVMALWPEAEPFVRQISDPAQMTMARYSHGSLWRPCDEGIAFIGDAAHRASPQLGQGANMALLDAAALAHSLDRYPIKQALLAYASARRWHVQAYQAISAIFTSAYQSDSRILPVVRDRLLFPFSQIPPMPYLLSRLVSGTLVPSGIK